MSVSYFEIFSKVRNFVVTHRMKLCTGIGKIQEGYIWYKGCKFLQIQNISERVLRTDNQSVNCKVGKNAN
jgi:hypothetical protein